MQSETDDLTLLKDKVIDNYQVSWLKDGSNQYEVQIEHKSDVMKHWHFEDSPASEAFSFYWFNCVCNMVQDERRIPEEVMVMSSKEVHTMLVKILKNL